MANKKISELQSRTPALSDLMLVGDPSSGYSYKCTVTALATIIETDIADGYVTIGTTQTISGAKTFSNNLTLTSVANATTTQTKFLTLNASNVVNYRTGAEVLSDIGGQGALTLTTSGSSGAATLVGNTLNIPNYGSALSGYVPYTGATTNVNLGTRYLQANYLVVDGQSNATGINFKQYSSVSFNGDGYTAMGPVSVDKMFFNFAQGSNIFKIFYFDVSGITGNATRAYTMPNSDGTLALTSQIPTVSGTTNYIPKFTSSSAIGNSSLYDDGTNIGLGTTTPDNFTNYRVFEVKATTGGILQSSNGTQKMRMYVTGQGTYFGSVSNDFLVFNTNDVERMRLTSGGSLGIGTSAPAEKFVVANGFAFLSQAYAWSIYNTTGTAWAARIGAAGDVNLNTTGNNAVIAANGANNILFGTNSSERMRLDASGNLGLGTTSTSAISGGYTGFFMNGSSGSNIDFRAGGTGYGRVQADVNGLLFAGLNSVPITFFTSGSERMRLDASGNLGLGVTPSPWSVYKSFDIETASLSAAGVQVEMVSNAYFNGSNWIYKSSTFPTRYVQNSGAAGGHSWFTAASGTAGNAISFTQAMTLFSTGNLAVGGTSDNGSRLNVTGAGYFSSSIDANSYIRNTNTGADNSVTISNDGSNAYIQANNAARTGYKNLLLNPYGSNVGIGTTSPAYPLQVAGIGKFEVQSGATNNTAPTALIVANKTTGAHTSSLGSSLQFEFTNSGGSYSGGLISSVGGADPFTADLRFSARNYGYVEAMRITSAGELLINTTSDAGDYKLQVNGNSYLASSTYTSGAILYLRDVVASGSNTSFAGLFLGSSPGTDYVIGKQSTNSVGTLAIKTGAGSTLLTLDASGNQELTGSIKTAAPSGGTAKPIKFGEIVTLGGSNTQGVRVEIDGTVYYLVTGYLP